MARIPRENRLAVLRRFHDALRERYVGGARITGAEFTAMVEAGFRLAVHPRTEPATTLTLLYQAHRLDRHNPRYPFHLGRVYLKHGRLDRAADWFAMTLRLSPTSHRAWSHLSIVQRALDERYQGQTEFTPGALRERAKKISAAVRDGVDNIPFELADTIPPPNSGVAEESAADSDGMRSPRVTNAGTCRWSGIHDIDVEAGYRLPTSARTRDELLPELLRVRDLAERRRGGVAAFVVLAIEWLVCGYPPGTVSKLIASLPPTDLAALEVLYRSLELFEVNSGDLPRRLAACADHDQLPPVVIALIHHRRLLGHPMTFPNLGALQAAKSFLAKPDGDGSELVAALTAAIAKARRPTSEPLAESATVGAAPTSVNANQATAKLASLEKTTELLGHVRVKTLVFVRDTLVPAAKSVSDEAVSGVVVADRATMTEVVELLKKTATAAHEDAARLVASLGHLGVHELAEDFHARADGCKTRLAELRNPGNLQRLLTRIKVQHAGTKDDEPSSEARVIRELVGRLSAVNVQATETTRSGAGESGMTVAMAVEDAHRTMTENFHRMRKTFDNYSPVVVKGDAIRSLRDFMSGHEAETLYRMGRTTEAKRIWYTMLAEDRLNLAVLRNLAVAHSSLHEASEATRAWQSYLEALYCLDIVEGSPRTRALERERIHRVCAAAYGPHSLLVEKASVRDEDSADIPDFLGRRSAVVTMSAHLRLEALNRILSYFSPTLVLGVGRTADGETLRQARDQQLAFVRETCALLPERVRAPFHQLCASHLESAYAESLDARRTLNRHTRYEDEEQAHLLWITKIILFKIRIRNAIAQYSGWAVTPLSGDVIGNLAVVDAMPLDATHDMTYQRALLLGMDDPLHGLERCNKLRELATNIALRRIIDEASESDSLIFGPRFLRIVESWRRNAVADHQLEKLDDPFWRYSDSVVTTVLALRDRDGDPKPDYEAVVRAATAMRHWVRALPGATGPIRLYAELLFALGEDKKALFLLSSAQKDAFHTAGGDKCEKLLAERALKLGDHQDANSRLRRLVERDPGNQHCWALLEEAQVRQIREISTPRNGSGLAEHQCGFDCPRILVASSTGRVENMCSFRARSRPATNLDSELADFDRWRARVIAASSADTFAGASAPVRQRLVVEAAVAEHRNPDGHVNWHAVVDEVKEIQSDDQHNSHAVYFEVLGLQVLAREASALLASKYQGDRGELQRRHRSVLEQCRSAAERFLRSQPSPARREHVEAVLRTVAGDHAR